ncbi:uncharacterized protein LOC104896988 isoform X3 [Beta vulgaris subsp. vulgaris]|uniref:uncharacterized protein LOC104896988 isoform X3 n=1 Tax=Beta vulgaris subsp. vulgaris TaxID=3555 RepID=UPI002036C2EC|nr:uncharacterized protein LOC104896988 isoform X3 [Beta vulgaris subsp. vulgaris]
MKTASRLNNLPYGIIVVAGNFKKSQSQPPKDSEPPPRIKSNVKQNLQFLKLWKEFQQKNSSIPKPATSYRRKRVEKEDLPPDIELYKDPTLSLYYTNQVVDCAVPVLLVDGYNVCGYWAKLKKHFMSGQLDIARQKLIDELVQFSLVVALKEDGCPKVWVVTSDHAQQHAAYGAGAFVWSSKALVSEIKASKKEMERMLQEQRSTSMQGKLLKHNLDTEVVDALKDLKMKLSQNDAR